MIATTAAEEPPRIVIPAAHQVSFGRIVARVPKGTRRVALLVDDKWVVVKAARRPRVTIRYRLPRRDVSLRIIAIDAKGSRIRSKRVGPVLGLPPRAAPRTSGAWELPPLRRKLSRRTRPFPGTSAVYVRDLVSGYGAGLNASALFPAASTLKVALAIEALRVTDGPPERSSQIGRLLVSMITASSNVDSNRLAVAIAGSTSAASARVKTLMRRIGMTGSDLFGGYAVEAFEHTGRSLSSVPREPPRPPPPIPLETVDAPRFRIGKTTTAADLATLFSAIHLAAGGRGPLIKHYRGAITPAEARHLLYLLANTSARGPRLSVGVPGATVAHKGGWITTARHDAGIVYHKNGAFVIAVMTFNPSGVGVTSDKLAANAARTTLRQLRR